MMKNDTKCTLKNDLKPNTTLTNLIDRGYITALLTTRAKSIE